MERCGSPFSELKSQAKRVLENLMIHRNCHRFHDCSTNKPPCCKAFCSKARLLSCAVVSLRCLLFSTNLGCSTVEGRWLLVLMSVFSCLGMVWEPANMQNCINYPKQQLEIYFAAQSRHVLKLYKQIKASRCLFMHVNCLKHA